MTKSLHLTLFALALGACAASLPSDAAAAPIAAAVELELVTTQTGVEAFITARTMDRGAISGELRVTVGGVPVGTAVVRTATSQVVRMPITESGGATVCASLDAIARAADG